MEIFFDAELEIRTKGDGRSLRGAFPYNKTATIRDRGRVRKERFKSGVSLPFIPSCLPTTARLSVTDIILSQWIL